MPTAPPSAPLPSPRSPPAEAAAPAAMVARAFPEPLDPSSTRRRTLVAHALSLTLQPLTVGGAIAVIMPQIFYPPSGSRLTVIIVGMLLLGLFPLLPILYAVARGGSDLMITQRTHRGPIFLSALTGYTIAAILFYFLGALAMAMIAGGFAFMTLILFAVNHRIKISVHMASMTGGSVFVVYVLAYYHWLPPVALVLVGAVCATAVASVAWARLHLHAHTRLEVFLGTAVAGAVTGALCVLAWH